MLQHGGGGRHAVEELDLPSVGVRDDVAAALVVSREHAARHHEVGARAERLGHVAGARAATVLGNDIIMIYYLIIPLLLKMCGETYTPICVQVGLPSGFFRFFVLVYRASGERPGEVD